jgi:hypothetical protein
VIDRQGGNIVFECDECGNALETEQADFSSAWNLAKRERWRTRKIGNDWVHKCPGCSKET